jgi:hypothetical protein
VGDGCVKGRGRNDNDLGLGVVRQLTVGAGLDIYFVDL